MLFQLQYAERLKRYKPGSQGGQRGGNRYPGDRVPILKPGELGRDFSAIRNTSHRVYQQKDMKEGGRGVAKENHFSLV